MKNFKKIMKLLFTTKVLVIVLILIFLLAVLLPASYYFITIDDAMWDKEEKGRPSNYTQNVEVSTDNEVGGLTVDKSTIIKQALMDLGYTEDEIANFSDKEIIEILGLNKKIKGENDFSTLDDVTAADVLWCMSDAYSKYLKTPEELEKLLNAEIITQYPKMGQDDAELDGIIQFERHKTDGTSDILTYTNYETFNNYVKNKNDDVLNYFTLDDEGNALIAVLNTKKETLTSNDKEVNISEFTQDLDETNKKSEGNYEKVENIITTQAINYKNFVQMYTMPFQYLWSLLVIGEDRKFVLELADLVEDSEITISIYDNITTTEDVTSYKYKKETRTDKYAKIKVEKDYGVKSYSTERYWLSKNSPEPDVWHYNSKYEAKYSTDETEYEVKDTVTTENNIPIVDLTKCNVWIRNYNKKYEYQEGITDTTQSNLVEIDDTEYVYDEEESNDSNDNSNLLEDEDAIDFANSVKKYIEKNAKSNTLSSNSINTAGGTDKDSTRVETDVDVTYVNIKKYNHKKERTQEKTQTSTVQKYIAQTPENKYKISKDTDEANFVTILCEKKHNKARKLMTNDGYDRWLFEILEKNTDTVNMVELTRYLFNKVTDSDKFGKDLNDTLLDSLFGGGFYSGETTTISGDIDVSDESKFITDVETLKKAFTGYSNSSKLMEHAQDFLDMQEKYKVNALFAAAVSITETGAGNAGNAIKIATTQNSVGATIGSSWNNWFNIKTSSIPYGILYNGEGESHYKIYNKVFDSIDNFGSNIANGNYYYKQGKYTVSDIGHTYCPNSEAYPTQGDDWVQNTLTYINNFYLAAGITIDSLTEGGFVQYYQGDYSNIPYGSSTLAVCGCGPTSFAMIASTLSGEKITPEDAISWCGNRYYVQNQGTSWIYFSAAASHFNLNVTVSQTASINDVISALKDGKYVISSQGPGLFTSGGHYIVLAGIDENDNIIVKDPNKNNAITKNYNNRLFTKTEINQAAKQYWIFN